MKSSFQLLWCIRYYLYLLGFIAAFFSFIAGLYAPWDPEILLFPIFMGVVIGPVFSFSYWSRSWIFPISDRQASWQPLAVTGAFWLVGFMTIIMIQGFIVVFHKFDLSYGHPYSFLQFWKEGVIWLPAVLFITMFIWRTSGYLSHNLLSFVFIFLQPSIHFFSLPELLGILRSLSSAMLLGAIFLIWEAPSWCGEVVRRDSEIASNRFLSSGLLTGPTHPRTRTVIANILVATVFTALFIYTLPRYLSPDVWQNPIFVIFAFVAFCAGFYALYIRHRASGLGQLSAVSLALIRMSGALYPIAPLFGVKNGKLNSCPNCNYHMFVWSNQCPHCQSDSRVCKPTPDSSRTATSTTPQHIEPQMDLYDWRPRNFIERIVPTSGDTEAFLYRLALPILGVVALILFL